MNYKPASKTQSVTPQSNNLVKMIKEYQGEIAAALPKHITPERMTRIIITEVRKNPKLADCDKASFFSAIVQCAQLGLEPGTGLGHAYLLPYKKECQLIIGYQGMIDLAERSGKVTIDAHLIYEKDDFNFTLGLNPSIEHKPFWGGDPGELIGSYAVARYADGRSKFRVLSKFEIDQARESSSSGKSSYSPWSTHYDEMARKTAIRRLFKLLPKTPEMVKVQEIEESKPVNEIEEKDINLDFLDVKAQEETEENVPQEILEG